MIELIPEVRRLKNSNARAAPTGCLNQIGLISGSPLVYRWCAENETNHQPLFTFHTPQGLENVPRSPLLATSPLVHDHQPSSDVTGDYGAMLHRNDRRCSPQSPVPRPTHTADTRFRAGTAGTASLCVKHTENAGTGPPVHGKRLFLARLNIK